MVLLPLSYIVATVLIRFLFFLIPGFGSENFQIMLIVRDKFLSLRALLLSFFFFILLFFFFIRVNSACLGVCIGVRVHVCGYTFGFSTIITSWRKWKILETRVESIYLFLSLDQQKNYTNMCVCVCVCVCIMDFPVHLDVSMTDNLVKDENSWTAYTWDACIVTVIIVGNGIGNMNSNPG